MRYVLMMLCLLLGSVASAFTQVSVGISLPGVSIGINLPVYPELVLVPGYPVYYAPRMEANYFFYDGMYWIYAEDNWYASYWYNGPWDVVYPEYVPLYILRVPVIYYRRPPVYFRGWQPGEPPRWGEHWGNDWEHQHSGWDRWNRRSAPAPAPLPAYQRQYSGDRYPQAEQQSRLHQKNYRYVPRDAVVRQQYRQQEERRASPSRQQEQGWPEQQREIQRNGPPASLPQGVPAGSRSPSRQWRGEDMPESAPQAPQRNRNPDAQDQRQSPQQGQPPQQRQQSQQRTWQPDDRTQGPGVKPQDRNARQQERQPRAKNKKKDHERDEPGSTNGKYRGRDD